MKKTLTALALITMASTASAGGIEDYRLSLGDADGFSCTADVSGLQHFGTGVGVLDLMINEYVEVKEARAEFGRSEGAMGEARDHIINAYSYTAICADLDVADVVHNFQDVLAENYEVVVIYNDMIEALDERRDAVTEAWGELPDPISAMISGMDIQKMNGALYNLMTRNGTANHVDTYLDVADEAISNIEAFLATTPALVAAYEAEQAEAAFNAERAVVAANIMNQVANQKEKLEALLADLDTLFNNAESFVTNYDIDHGYTVEELKENAKSNLKSARQAIKAAQGKIPF